MSANKNNARKLLFSQKENLKMGKCTKRPTSLSLLIFSTIFLLILVGGGADLPQAGADDVNLGTSYFLDVGSSPNKVWVSPNYNDKTKGWGKTRFAKIQDGVDAVAEGGTVSVGKGTYRENVGIQKSMDLIGDDKEETIINAQRKGCAIHIEGVKSGTVSGLTLTRASGGWKSGLLLKSCANLEVRDNIIKNNEIGIRLEESRGITVEENRIHTNDTGIRYVRALKNHIRKNDFAENGYSVYGSNSWSNIFENNTMIPTIWGFSFDTNEKNSVVRNNYIDGNTYIACTPIRSSGCSYNLYENNTIVGGNHPIWMAHDEGSIIAGNAISGEYWDNGDVISLYHAKKCTIINNTITHIEWEGHELHNSITLANNSSNNTVQSNIISDGHLGISLLNQSNNNIVTHNEVSKACYGIVVDDSSKNSIYKNNFINNNSQGYANKKSMWSFKGKGNYWSDYAGTDSNGDGIGDAPYKISPRGSDPCPLMKSLKIRSAKVPRLKRVEYEPTDQELEIVSDRQVWKNETRDLVGLCIEKGGSLTLKNVTLKVPSSIATLASIVVHSGASLKIYNSKLFLSGGSIEVNNGAKFILKDSEIYQGGAWAPAIDIKTNGAVVKNNYFEDISSISINGAQDTNITDNTVKNCRRFLSLRPGTNDLNVEGNQVENVILSCFRYVGTNYTISKNIFKNIWGLAFVCCCYAEVDNVVIAQNTFKDVRGELFHISGYVENQIYKNNFINYGSIGWEYGDNKFNKNRQGNYWSRYLEQCPDAQENTSYPGVWDSPLILPGGGNQDNFPLMCPFYPESPLTPPGQPVLKSPYDYSFVSLPLILRWYPVSRATEYWVQISTDSSFKTSVINKGQIKKTFLRVEGLHPSTQYFWRVNAATEGCYGNWSNVWSFLTGN